MSHTHLFYSTSDIAFEAIAKTDHRVSDAVKYKMALTTKNCT